MSFDAVQGLLSRMSSLAPEVATVHGRVVRIKMIELSLSIFNPISTALNKAKLNESDIDYVLFIGGSAKNPLIQQAIKDRFHDSSYLLPRDLQTHVSKGAAVNSLLYNGYNEL